ncbi:uncharacterized protein METZ01_LOCUS329783 [marine metagenome]|uniref:Uncharacterized protein n=1 Tax=marine metagenome TaxID=408172 RepID=A0A382PUB4_9ZZZZ
MICEGPFGDRIAFNSPKFSRRELKSWLRSLHGRELSESLSASEISHPFRKKQLQLVDPWHTSARPTNLEAALMQQFHIGLAATEPEPSIVIIRRYTISAPDLVLESNAP